VDPWQDLQDHPILVQLQRHQHQVAFKDLHSQQFLRSSLDPQVLQVPLDLLMYQQVKMDPQDQQVPL
jgi:hypothetical protein